LLQLISDRAGNEQTSGPAQVLDGDAALLDAFSRTVVDVAEHTGPAVVAVRRRAPEHDPDNPFAPVLGAGSGVIITPDGYVLTNDHVVRGVQRLDAVLSDGTSIEARIVGEDPERTLPSCALRAAACRPPPSVIPARFGSASSWSRSATRSGCRRPSRPA
jgi:S1-C subfamily serine protease